MEAAVVAEKLRRLCGIIQHDVGERGLSRLFGLFPDDFAQACRSLAAAESLGVVTGFWIPGVGLPETDGPLGAVYLARTLGWLGISVPIISDPFCRPAHEAGLSACHASTSLFDLGDDLPPLTHLLAVERVGPNRHGRCHSMRGVDITDRMGNAAALFERGDSITIGIGDGGNEIGMGKVTPRIIAEDIRNGELIACRVATDYLIVAGISNWGAYALACGVAVVKGVRPPDDWFDVALERHILREMLEKGALIDGVTGRSEDSVDGLPFDRYIEPLIRMKRIVRG